MVPQNYPQLYKLTFPLVKRFLTSKQQLLICQVPKISLMLFIWPGFSFLFTQNAYNFEIS